MSTKTKHVAELSFDAVPKILLIGLNHKSAEISIREKLHFNDIQKQKILEQIVQITEVFEATMLCTCNRTEVTLVVSSLENVLEKVKEIFISASDSTDFLNSLYVYEDEIAVEHIFLVACGLDSLIPGEQQIAGQQKSSYLFAKEKGFVGIILNRLYQRAFGISKNVRTQTAIGRKAVSVSYAAKELSAQIFGDLSEVSVMLIGAGATGTLAAKYFRSAGVKRFFVVNRSFDKAQELAKTLGGQAADLENFHSLLALSDVVIGASLVDSGNFILQYSELKKILNKREGVAQFLIDLGLPRNFDPKISNLSDVFLYSLDDLEHVVSENINSRTMEFDRARLIIHEEVEAFKAWHQNMPSRESIKELVGYCEKLANDECQKTMLRLKKAGFAASQSSELKQAVDALAESLLSKIMHFPIKALRENNHQIEDVFKELLKKQ